MIVDEADLEIEMAIDPFIEAGIEVPPNLPYQENKKTEESYKKVLGDEEEASSMTNKLRKLSRRMSGWVMAGKKGDDTSTTTIKKKNRPYSMHQDLLPAQLVSKPKQTVR